jgi:eukaryotic-like serine/threonine-protein kinase
VGATRRASRLPGRRCLWPPRAPDGKLVCWIVRAAAERSSPSWCLSDVDRRAIVSHPADRVTNPSLSPLLVSLRQALQGRYDVERELGAGGMGQVLLGRDVALDRPVAIKVIAPDLASSPASRERFLREARTVARLRHPNIVAVYAAGEADNLLYFVMEYVEGESLRQMLDREGRAEGARARQAVPLLADLARALGYAHAQGVIHRDVKPENVLLDAATGRAMLTDFGVARAFASGTDSDGDSAVTRTGFVVGSPRYMSPEQAVGERELDGRSDIYSLGLVGYEIFAGSAPFTGSSPMAVLTKQLTEAPPPLAQRRPDLPVEVSVTIDRALSKQPADRWPTAEDFARALEGATPLSVAAAGTPRPTERTVVSQPVAAGRVPRWSATRIAAAAAVVLAAAVGAFMWMRPDGAPRGVDPRKSFFVAPFEILSGGEQLAWLREGSASMLTLNLAQWSDLNVVSYERGLDLLREAQLDTARRIGLAEARSMARKAGAWSVVMGQVTAAGDSVLVTARVFDVASGRQVHQAQQSGSRTADPRPLFDGLTRQLLDVAGAPASVPIARLSETTTESIEAYRAYLEGTRAMNRWHLDRADSLFALATARDSNFTLAYYHRAMVLGWRQVGDSLHQAVATRAASLANRLPPRERELVTGYAELTAALTSEGRGDTLTSQRKFTAAEQHYAAAIARDSGDAESWYGLADAYWHHKPDGWGRPQTIANWTRALRAFDRTLALDSTFYLAYAHKIDLYRQAAGQVPNLLLAGDSLRIMDPATLQRPGMAEQLRTAQRRAFDLAVGDARAWIAAAPSTTAYQSLAVLFFTRGHPDSAAVVMREAMARGDSRGPQTPFLLTYAETGTDPLVGVRLLRDAIRTADVRSLRQAGSNNLIEFLFGAGSAAGLTGHLGLADSLSALAARTVDPPPGLGLREDPRTRLWSVGVRLAAGMPHRTVAPQLAVHLATLERLPRGAGDFLRAQTVPVLYVTYLVNRDARTLALLRRWRGANAPFVELDALEALDARDTATARRAVQGFPSADSIRAAKAPVALVRWIARARAYEELGDVRAALAAYSVLEPRQISPMGQSDPAWPLYARSLLWRGRLQERLGDRVAARDSYRRLVALWAGADPALQPQRDSAEVALRRLGDDIASVAIVR